MRHTMYKLARFEFITACALLGFSPGCGHDSSPDDFGQESEVDSDPAGGKADNASGSSGAVWTAFVYGAFDTHDSGGIPSSLMEMAQKVTQNSDRVNLLYLQDEPDDNNTRLYRVTARKTEVVKDYGELPTGDPATLTSVLKFVREKYPSTYLFVDLIGHTNSGVAAFLPDYEPPSSSWEKERMAYWEVRQGLLDAGGNIDVLALSGCGTGDLEIAARMSDVASYVVGLQEYSTGYTDVRWASSLMVNPSITPRSLARRVAEGEFKKGYYEQKSPGALGAYDSSMMPGVKSAFSELCATLNADVPAHRADLAAARKNVLEMKSEGFEFLVDAHDFAEQLEAISSDPAVRSKAGSFRLALDPMMVAGGPPSCADSELHQNAHGINLVFPRSGLSGRITSAEDFDAELSAWPAAETSFYEETGWVQLMTALESVDQQPRSLSIEVDYVGYQRFEPGTIALLESYFASLGISLTVEESEELEPVDVLECGVGSAMLKDYYVNHFGHRGQPGWHYLLMADTLANGNRGWGMMGGDVFVVSAAMLDSYPAERTRAQAHIILHELGHNLGLTHEGFEPELTAGTHSPETCASAAFPAEPVPATFYSPGCVAHLKLESVPMVP